MTFFFNEGETSSLGVDLVQTGGEEPGFFDSISSAYYEQRYVKNSDANLVLLDEYMQPVLNTIAERGGPNFINPSHYYGGTDSMGGSEEMRGIQTQKIIDYLNENADVFPEYQNLSLDKINQEIVSRAKNELAKSQSESEKRYGVLPSIGEFIGTAGGFLTDRNLIEVTVMTGAGGFSQVARAPLWKTALGAGLLEAGREATVQTATQKWYKELGLKYDYKDFLTNVGSAGLFGAGFPVAFRGISLTYDQARGAVKALRKDGAMSKSDADVINASIDESELLGEIPPNVDPLEHARNLDDATADIGIGRLPGETDVPTHYSPLPKIDDIEDLTPDTYARALDDLADDELIQLADEIEPLSGASLKQDFAADDSALDRLRGCVV